MDSRSDTPGMPIRSDLIELELGMESILQPRLLEIPSESILGKNAFTEKHRGKIHLQTGRRPIAHNLGAIFRRNGRDIPDDFQIFWDFEIWMIEHSVGIRNEGGDETIQQLTVELRFPEEVTIVDVLPQSPFIERTEAGWQCKADLNLNGRAIAATAAIAELACPEQLRFGGIMQAVNHAEVASRLSFPTITPHIQVTGTGDYASQIVLSRTETYLTGSQLILVIILVDKFARELPCSARVQGTIEGLNALPTRLRSRWIPFTVHL